jgi:hypothetical protein
MKMHGHSRVSTMVSDRPSRRGHISQHASSKICQSDVALCAPHQKMTLDLKPTTASQTKSTQPSDMQGYFHMDDKPHLRIGAGPRLSNTNVLKEN